MRYVVCRTNVWKIWNLIEFTLLDHKLLLTRLIQKNVNLIRKSQVWINRLKNRMNLKCNDKCNAADDGENNVCEKYHLTGTIKLKLIKKSCFAIRKSTKFSHFVILTRHGQAKSHTREKLYGSMCWFSYISTLRSSTFSVWLISNRRSHTTSVSWKSLVMSWK